MSRDWDDLEVVEIRTDGGIAEPDYSECETAGDVLEAMYDAGSRAFDYVTPVYMKCTDGWYYGEMKYEFVPVEERDVPDACNFAQTIIVQKEEQE